MKRLIEMLTKPHERPQAFDDARSEHLRVFRKVNRALPDDTALKAELLRAERAMRGQADG